MALGFLHLFLLIASSHTFATSHADGVTSSAENEEFDIRMPGARVSKTNVHLCHAFEVKDNEPLFITGYKPLVDSSVAHHATLFACENPARSDEIWNCAFGVTKEPTYEYGGICAGSSASIPILYDWVLNGDYEGIMLPPGVGFPVGGDSAYRSIVLQVHYNHTDKTRVTLDDTSGIKIFFTRTQPAKLMGLFLSNIGGQFQPKTLERAESACLLPIPAGDTLHIFAYQVHTHELGLMVAAYKVRNSTWTEIGRRDPQLPENTLPTDAVLTRGDWFALRCTMYNTKQRLVRVGLNYEDEMCQFYGYYYMESGTFIPKMACSGQGPPLYYWRLDKHVDLQNAPEDNVSVSPSPDEPARR